MKPAKDDDAKFPLQWWMTNKGFTIAKLARESGVHEQGLYRIRDGKTANPTDETKQKILAALGEPVDNVEWGAPPDDYNPIRERTDRRTARSNVKFAASELLGLFNAPITWELAQEQMAALARVQAVLNDYHAKNHVDRDPFADYDDGFGGTQL